MHGYHPELNSDEDEKEDAVVKSSKWPDCYKKNKKQKSVKKTMIVTNELW